MTTFDWAAAIAARPSGLDAGLRAVLGDPTVGAARTGGGKFTPGPGFSRRLVKVPLSALPGWPKYQGTTPVSGVTVHEQVAPVLVATWAEVCRRGLAGRVKSYDGAFMGRHMLWQYSRPVSVHAFGAAVDFDAATNGYGIPAARMQIDPEFVRCWEECGWESGTRWNPTDGMHMQWTDPLPGVPQAPWRDAMGRAVVIPALPPRSTTVFLTHPGTPIKRAVWDGKPGAVYGGHTLDAGFFERVRAMYPTPGTYPHGGVLITVAEDGALILARI